MISSIQHGLQAAMQSALLPYLLLAFGLMGSLTLFLSVKREMRSLSARHSAEVEELMRKINQAPPMESVDMPVCAQASPRSGLNINKRIQAMRMVRRKEDVSHIAAALGVTRREVELLIRVQGLVGQPLAAASRP